MFQELLDNGSRMFHELLRHCYKESLPREIRTYLAHAVERCCICHCLDCDILISSEDSKVRVSCIGDRNPNNQRISIRTANVSGGNCVVEFQGVIEELEVIGHSSWCHDIVEVASMNSSKRVATSSHLDHVGRVESHSRELIDEDSLSILRLRNTNWACNCHVYPSTTHGDNGSATRSSTCIDPEGHKVTNRELAVEKIRVGMQRRVEPEADVLPAAIELVQSFP